MKYGKGYSCAWDSHDAIFKALIRLAEHCTPPDGSKPSNDDLQTLCKLSQELDRWQERIRTHRSVLKKRVAKAKAAKLQVSSKPAAPSHEEAELDVAGAEDAEALGTMTDRDSSEAQSE